MRNLITLGLCACITMTAAAQTEVIIRRPGQKDQVIRLDSNGTYQFRAKLDSELRSHQRELDAVEGHAKVMMDTLYAKTLALRSSDVAREARAKIVELTDGLKKQIIAETRQPHLGVWVDTRPRDSDKFGAFVQMVTPGSPAAKAGIVAGDVITRIAGQSLTGVRSDNPEESGPGMRLITIVSKLEAGKTVEVQLRRGDATKTVNVTPVEDNGVALAIRTPEPERALTLEGMARAVPGGVMTLPPGDRGQWSVFTNNGPGEFFYSFGTSNLFANYELAPVNEKLGAYFGTTDGVLVVNVMEPSRVAAGRMMRDSTAPKLAVADSERAVEFGSLTMRRAAPPVQLGLEPGDVIVSVDGRKVTSPGQLMRIVATYDHGDQFKLQIMRQKRAESIDVKMP